MHGIGGVKSAVTSLKQVRENPRQKAQDVSRGCSLRSMERPAWDTSTACGEEDGAASVASRRYTAGGGREASAVEEWHDGTTRSHKR
jgi:hypothetical protein